MSSFNKKLHQYRQGEEFEYLNHQNVSEAIKKILTTKEGKKHYDRLGNLSYTDKTNLQPLTIDETIFRLMVLLETQMADYAESQIPIGDYEADRAEAKAIAHNVTEEK